MITLIGTGHVFDLRQRLQRELMARGPDVVCLELDPGRLQALLSKRRGGKAPLTYRLLAEFQTRMADAEGISPGDEMLAAFEAARDARVPVELIDMDAQAAFQRLWREMSLLEKARFTGSAVLGLVLPRGQIEKELDRMQGDYTSFFEVLGREYPTVKRVLIDDRNEHMAQRLAGLAGQGKERIVAVIGDGHVEGVKGLLDGQGLQVEAVRLKDLRVKEPDQASTVTWTTQVEWGDPGR